MKANTGVLALSHINLTLYQLQTQNHLEKAQQGGPFLHAGRIMLSMETIFGEKDWIQFMGFHWGLSHPPYCKEGFMWCRLLKMMTRECRRNETSALHNAWEGGRERHRGERRDFCNEINAIYHLVMHQRSTVVVLAMFKGRRHAICTCEIRFHPIHNHGTPSHQWTVNSDKQLNNNSCSLQYPDNNH